MVRSGAAIFVDNTRVPATYPWLARNAGTPTTSDRLRCTWPWLMKMPPERPITRWTRPASSSAASTWRRLDRLVRYLLGEVAFAAEFRAGHRPR